MANYTSILAHPTLNTGLIGHYNLDYTPADSTGNVPIGTAENAPTWYWPGVRGPALLLASASSQAYNLGTDSKLNPTGAISISIWYYAASQSTQIVTRRSDTTWSQVCYAIQIAATTPQFLVGNGTTGVTLSAGAAAAASTWHHLVATYDGSMARLYVDGYFSAETALTGAMPSLAIPTLVGARATGGSPYSGRTGYFNGRVDNLTFHNRALTPQEVFDLYNYGSGLPYYAPATTFQSHSTLKTGLAGAYFYGPSSVDLTAQMRNAVALGATAPAFTAPTTYIRCWYVALNSAVTDQSYYIASHSDYTPANFAVSCAVSINSGGLSTTQDRGLITKRGISGWANLDWSLQTYYDGSVQRWAFLISRDGATGVTLLSAAPISIQTWSHLAADFDGTTVRLFVNGELSASAALSGAMAYRAANYKIRIGAYGGDAAGNDPTSGTSQVRAAMTAVTYHTRAFSSLAEVRDLYSEDRLLSWNKLGVRTTDVKTHSTLTSGLIAAYDFSSSLANSPIIDSGPNKIHGVSSSGNWGTGYGKIGEGVRLDGPGYSNYGYFTSTLLNPDYITVAVWLRNGGYNSADLPAVARKAYPDTGSQYVSYYLGSSAAVTPSKWTFGIGTGAGATEVVTATPDTVACSNAWSFMVGTFDGTKVLLYKDGILISAIDHASPGVIFKTPAQRTNLACYTDSTNIPTGQVRRGNYDFDCLLFYSRALTPEEISDLYNDYNSDFTGEGVPYEASGIGDVYYWEHGVYPVSQPILVSAVRLGTTSVRLMYDTAMKCSNSSDPKDTLRAANYSFYSETGASISPVSVSLYQENPTIVDILITGEMTTDAVYTVTAATTIESLDEMLIDADRNTASFLGLGVSPVVVLATAQTTPYSSVIVDYNEPMLPDTELTRAANYVFTGPTALTAHSVSFPVPGDTSTVLVRLIQGMQQDGAYRVTVSNVHDLAGNHLGTPDYADFTGVSSIIELTAADAVDTETILVTYSKVVEDSTATDKDNYAIVRVDTGDPLSVIDVVKYGVGDSTYQLTVSPMAATEYRITVTGVEDAWGNVIEAPYNTLDFMGIGNSPPLFEIHPSDEAKNVPPRVFVRVRAYDDPAEFTGVDRNSWWVRVEYIDENGNAVSAYPVYNGELQPAFDGELTGDGLTADGLRVRFRPTTHHFPANTNVVVTTFARDMEGTRSAYQWEEFFTGEYTCYEDKDVTISPTEQRVIDGFPGYESTDKLRKILMYESTYSAKRYVQAKTVVYLANTTEIKSLLATGEFDFDSLDGVMMCDRKNTLDIAAAMMMYRSLIDKSIDEIPGITVAGKDYMKKILYGDSPIYLVNIAAICVLLVALRGSF